MQTRKNFIAAAQAVALVTNSADRVKLANHHAAIFTAENPRFDKSRFFAACGVK